VFDQSSPCDPASLVSEGQVGRSASPLRRIQVVANVATPGLPGARNTGVRVSHCSLVAFCDDDDIWLPGKLRDQVELLGMHPEADAVAGGIRLRAGGRTFDRVPSAAALTFPMLLRRRHTEVHASTYVVRRSALEGAIGLFDEAVPGGYGEDYDWLLRATRRAPVPLVRRPLTEVTWHERSYFGERWADVADGFAYLLGKHPELARDRRGYARVAGRIAFASAADGRRAAAREWRRRTRRAARREPRTYLSWLVEHRLVRAATLLRLAHRTGRGI